MSVGSVHMRKVCAYEQGTCGYESRLCACDDWLWSVGEWAVCGSSGPCVGVVLGSPHLPVRFSVVLRSSQRTMGYL